MLANTITPDKYVVGADGAWTTYALADENTKQKLRAGFVELYVDAFYFDEEEFEKNVTSFFPDPAESKLVIDDICNNYTFVPDPRF